MARGGLLVRGWGLKSPFFAFFIPARAGGGFSCVALSLVPAAPMEVGAGSSRGRWVGLCPRCGPRQEQWERPAHSSHPIPSHPGDPRERRTAPWGPQPHISSGKGSLQEHPLPLASPVGRQGRVMGGKNIPGPIPQTPAALTSPPPLLAAAWAQRDSSSTPKGAAFKAPPPHIHCPHFQHLWVEKWPGRVWQRSLAQIIQQLFPILRPRLPHPPVTMTKSGAEPAPAAGVLRSGTAQKYLLSGTNIYQPFCLLFLWFSYIFFLIFFFSRHSLAKCHTKQQPRNFGVAAWLLWALFFSRANC